mmetsp:Transcript_4186/g.11247  ORF Transcript_4186/g.11247 Transcript_4186/m.11247 type:complete len:403 (+) Transcript_4186:187-1395(+)
MNRISQGSTQGKTLAMVLALPSSISTPLLLEIDCSISGDIMDCSISGEMFFIMSSVAFIMSGSFIIEAMSGGPSPGPPAPGPAPPLIFALMFIMFSICSGLIFFIISDIDLIISGFEAICAAASRMALPSSGLLTPSRLRSSSVMPCVIPMACCNISGLSKIADASDGDGIAGAPPPPPPLARPRAANICLRWSSGMALRLSIAVFNISGFFWRCSIWLLIILASIPGGNGWLPIILSRSSGFICDMASVACFSISGFSASEDAALTHLSSTAGAGALLLLAGWPPCSCHTADTSCFPSRFRPASSMPLSRNCPRSCSSSALMALSEGCKVEACLTSSTASERLPIPAWACPRRNRALKFLASSLRTSSQDSRASPKCFVFRWQRAELFSRLSFSAETSAPL